MNNNYIEKTINSYLNDKINFTICYNRIIEFYENQNLFINIEFLKDFLPSLYLKNINNLLPKEKKQKYFNYFFENILK